MIGLLNYFEDIFGGALLYWDNKPVDIDHKKDPNPVRLWYYPAPIINKRKSQKKLQCLYKYEYLPLYTIMDMVCQCSQ